MSKKEIKTKDKRSAKKTVGAVQADYQKEVRKLLLYMWTKSFGEVELAYWPYVGQGFTQCQLEIRFKDFASAMLSLQYQPRRKRSRLLRPNVKGNRPRSNGKTGSRSQSKRQSSRSLFTINNGVRKSPEYPERG